MMITFFIIIIVIYLHRLEANIQRTHPDEIGRYIQLVENTSLRFHCLLLEEYHEYLHGYEIEILYSFCFHHIFILFFILKA